MSWGRVSPGKQADVMGRLYPTETCVSQVHVAGDFCDLGQGGGALARSAQDTLLWKVLYSSPSQIWFQLIATAPRQHYQKLPNSTVRGWTVLIHLRYHGEGQEEGTLVHLVFTEPHICRVPAWLDLGCGPAGF